MSASYASCEIAASIKHDSNQSWSFMTKMAVSPLKSVDNLRLVALVALSLFKPFGRSYKVYIILSKNMLLNQASKFHLTCLVPGLLS